jgi:hypothetical protein
MRFKRSVSRRLVATGMALAMAGAGAWASSGGQERPPAPTRQPVPDTSSVRPDDRRAYEDFWKRQGNSKADAFERQIIELEGRQRRGDNIDRDVEKIRKAYPELGQMSASLVQTARWTVVGAGGAKQAATCTGLGGVTRKGHVWCLGRMTTG